MVNVKKVHNRWFQLFRTNVAFWSAAGMMAPFLSAYYKSIGLTSLQIGALFAISPICAICIQPLWAYVSDKTGKRSTVLGVLAVCTAFACLLYYAGKTFLSCMAATIVVALFSSALLPLCDAIVIDRAETFRCNFATIRIGGTLGYALVVVLVGMLVERWPGIQFALAWMGYLIFALAVWHIPAGEEPERKPARKAAGEAASEKGIFVDREIFFVLLFAFIMSIGLGFCGSFTGVYVLELGHSTKLVGILSCVSALSEVPVLLCVRKLTKRFGEIPLLILSMAMTSLRLFLIGQGMISAMIDGQLLQGVTYMTTYYCCTRYISTHVKPGKISQGQSVLTLVQSGLAAVTGNMAGGWLVDYAGTKNAFMTMAMVVLSASGLAAAAYLLYNKGNQHRKQVF